MSIIEQLETLIKKEFYNRDRNKLFGWSIFMLSGVYPQLYLKLYSSSLQVWVATLLIIIVPTLNVSNLLFYLNDNRVGPMGGQLPLKGDKIHAVVNYL